MCLTSSSLAEGQKVFLAEHFKNYRIFPSARFAILCLVCLGCVVTNSAWFSLNFSIACMVNATYLKDTTSGNKSLLAASLPCKHKVAETEQDYGGTFLWDRYTQSLVIGAEAWGATVFTIPVGLLVDRFGIKWLYVAANVITGVCSALIPTVAFSSPYYVVFLRFMQGISMQMAWPACIVISSIWFPQREVGFLMALMASGFQLGSLFTMAVSGSMCSSVGWQPIFYLTAALAVAAAALLAAFFSDDVEECRYISEAEKFYIFHNRSHRVTKQRVPVPYLALFTSPALWCIIAANFSVWYISYFFADFVATYFKEVLLISTTSNGLMAALPYLMQLVGRIFAGWLSDHVSRWLTPTISTRLFTGLSGFVPSALILVLVLFDCTKTQWAVGLLCCSYLFLGLFIAGYPRAMCTIAPQFAGTVSCAGSAAAYISGILAPLAAAALTPSGSPGEWNRALSMTGGIGIVGTAIFVCFGTAKVQPWAMMKLQTQISTTSAAISEVIVRL